MPPVKVPSDDHVMRFVPNARVKRDEADNIVGMFPQAFSHREGEDYLSVTWLEFFSPTYEAAYAAAAAAIRAELTVKKRAAFAVGQVRRVISACEGSGLKVRVLHEKTDKNPGHCAMRGLQKAEDQLLALLADEVFCDIRGANVI